MSTFRMPSLGADMQSGILVERLAEIDSRAHESIGTTLLAQLEAVAPGSVPETVDPDTDLRDEMDLDSMDILAWPTAIHDELRVEIPQADIDQVLTLNTALAYVASRLCR